MPSAAALAIERARSHQTFVRERALQFKQYTPAQIMAGGFPAVAELAFGTALAQHTEQYQHFSGWAYVAIKAGAQRVAGQPVRMGRKTIEPGPESWAWDRPPGRKLSKLDKMRAPLWIKALDADIEQIDTDPLLDAIANPNSEMTKWALFFHTICSLLITGRGYWWFTHGDKEKLDIWPLPADWVTPIRTAEKLLAGYRISPTGQFGQGEIVEPESIAAFTLPDPANPVTGAISPLQTQSPAVAVDEQIQSSQYRFFKNGAFPGVLIKAGRLPSMTGAGEGPQIELTQAQRSQIYSMVRQNWQGAVNTNVPLIVDGGLIQGVERFSLTGQELDFLQSGEAIKARIFQAFGVSPIITGEIAGVNRAQAAVADNLFVSGVVNPLCTLIGEVMTKHIGEKDTYFWIELAQADDAELRLRQWQAILPFQVVKRNEYRQEILGLPPTEDETGEEYIGQAPPQPSPFGGAFGAPPGGEPKPPEKPEEKPGNGKPKPGVANEGNGEGESVVAEETEDTGKSTRPLERKDAD